MKQLSVLILGLLITTSTYADVFDEVASAIRSGDSKALSRYFGNNVELKLLDLEDIYSKSQAELIMKDFFSKHPIEAFFISHKSAPKNNSMYAIGTIQTKDGRFRTYCFLRKQGDKYLVQQFRIERDNPGK